MRKLLFLTSLLSLGFIHSCGNHKDAKTLDEPIIENLNEHSEMISDSAQLIDAGVSEDSLVRKGKKYKGEKKEAPKHGTPDQQKLDSIKAAKAKEKSN